MKVPFRAGRGAALALASLERFIKSLARDKTVFLLLDNPGGLQFNPKAYIQGSRLTSLRARSLALFSKFDDKQSELRQELMKIAQRAGAAVIDPVLHLCKAGYCALSLDDGTPIYKDDSHLRPQFVREFADFIDIAIKLPAPR